MTKERTMVRRQWIRRLTDPDEPLTLAELSAVPAALLLREMSTGELVAPLDTAVKTGLPMTMLEAFFIALVHTRENVKDGRLAAQRTEGVMATLDEFMADPSVPYAQVAAKRAQPVPMIPEQEAS